MALAMIYPDAGTAGRGRKEIGKSVANFDDG
jgi:hypothetical protein